MQEIIYIIVLSFGSIITLFVLTKLMGYRQMSEMSMFDYINGITIGSIAAEMATSLEQSFWQPFTAMVVYGILIFARKTWRELAFKSGKIEEVKVGRKKRK